MARAIRVAQAVERGSRATDYLCRQRHRRGYCRGNQRIQVRDGSDVGVDRGRVCQLEVRKELDIRGGTRCATAAAARRRSWWSTTSWLWLVWCWADVAKRRTKRTYQRKALTCPTRPVDVVEDQIAVVVNVEGSRNAIEVGVLAWTVVARQRAGAIANLDATELAGADRLALGCLDRVGRAGLIARLRRNGNGVARLACDGPESQVTGALDGLVDLGAGASQYDWPPVLPGGRDQVDRRAREGDSGHLKGALRARNL